MKKGVKKEEIGQNKKNVSLKTLLSIFLFMTLLAIFIMHLAQKNIEEKRGLMINNEQGLSSEYGPDKETYFISSSEPGPNINEVSIVPFQPRVGDKQSVSIKATYAEEIEDIYVTFKFDNKEYKHKAKLINGDNKKGDWEVSWDVKDTHDSRYVIIIEGESKGIKSLVELTLK